MRRTNTNDKIQNKNLKPGQEVASVGIKTTGKWAYYRGILQEKQFKQVPVDLLGGKCLTLSGTEGKVNNLDPYSYLRIVFKELPKAQLLEDFEKLLPHRIASFFTVKQIST